MQSRQERYRRLHRALTRIERGRRDELQRLRQDVLALEGQWQGLQHVSVPPGTLHTAGAMQHEMRLAAVRKRQQAALELRRQELARQEPVVRRKLVEATQTRRALQRLLVRLQDEQDANLRKDEQAWLDEQALRQVRE